MTESSSIPTTTYRVELRKSGKWWAISVPGIPGAVGQSSRRDFDSLAEDCAEMIADFLDVPKKSILVDLEWIDD